MKKQGKRPDQKKFSNKVAFYSMIAAWVIIIILALSKLFT